jgi:hypothetical protein
MQVSNVLVQFPLTIHTTLQHVQQLNPHYYATLYYTLVPAGPGFMHNWITGQTRFRKQSVKLCRKCLPSIKMVAEISSCKRRKTDNVHKWYKCQKWMRVPNVISQLCWTLSVVWNIHNIHDVSKTDTIPISEGMVFLLKHNWLVNVYYIPTYAQISSVNLY